MDLAYMNYMGDSRNEGLVVKFRTVSPTLRDLCKSYDLYNALKFDCWIINYAETLDTIRVIWKL